MSHTPTPWYFGRSPQADGITGPTCSSDPTVKESLAKDQWFRDSEKAKAEKRELPPWPRPWHSLIVVPDIHQEYAGNKQTINSVVAILPNREDETGFKNGERIVACVNACEGINPESIPLIISTLKALAYSGMDELYWLIPPQPHGPENPREKARQIAELLLQLLKNAGVFRPATGGAE